MKRMNVLIWVPDRRHLARRFQVAKAVLCAIATSLVAACATPTHNYMPVVVAISNPPIGSVNTTSIGDVLLQQGKYREHEAILVRNIVQVGFAYTIHPGYYLKHGNDQAGEFYRPGGGEEAGRVDKVALADNWQSVMAKRNPDNLCVVTIFNVASCSDSGAFERMKKAILSHDSFQQTLIYSGKVGNKINVGYREFSGNIARPAFNNNVEYDLSESKTIGYKGAVIEVIEATNQHIKYKVIKNFNSATL
jgi:hypothetical protein